MNFTVDKVSNLNFTADKVSNCNPSNLLINNQQFISVAKTQGWQAAKKFLSIFCCICCCVDNPSSSLLLQHADKLGIPPKTLVTDNAAEGQFIVISYVSTNADGIEEKTPLLFTGNMQVANAVMDELSQIYFKSSQMNVMGIGPSLEDLDSQAQVWHQLFGLPETSRGTQQLAFKSTLKPGDSIVDAAKNYKSAAFTVKPLATDMVSLELVSINNP